MKKIKVRKAGTVRLTSAATLYDCGCAINCKMPVRFAVADRTGISDPFPEIPRCPHDRCRA